MFCKSAILILASSAAGLCLPALAEPPASQTSFSPQRPLAFTDARQEAAFSGTQLNRSDTEKAWGRGQSLPHQYLSAEFRDWQLYGLSPAPEGHRWVRIGRGAYRVDVQTGYIAEAVYGLPAN